MLRNRLTWGETGTRQRRASAHPSTPDEGPASPAYKGKDPDADAYENGDTSAWAEDPTKGPYTNPAHPSTPDEGPASPAYKAAALERKAAKCIRLATAMLGKKASVNQIEDQALILMDLSDRAIHASLSRLGGEDPDAALVVPESMDDEALVQEMLEAEGMAEETPVAPESMAEEKMARLFERRISRIEATLGRSASKSVKPTDTRKASTGRKADDALLQEMLEAEGMWDAPAAPEAMAEETPTDMGELEAMLGEMMGDEDLLLGEMLVDEGMVDDLSTESMMPKAMPAESMMPMAKEPAAPAAAPAPAPEAMGEEEDPMMDPMMESPLEDPMGVFEDGMDAEERAILAKIFRGAGEDAAPASDEETEEEDEEEEEVEEAPKAPKAPEAPAEKTARLRPQPKKASAGATRLGGVSKSAASNSELDELSKLWESSPDVSKYFG